MPAPKQMSNTISCERCKRRCRTAKGNPEARILRASEGPGGLCAACAVTYFLQNTSPVCDLLKEKGPGILRLAHVQEQFAEIMRIGHADASPDEIDWEAVIGMWDVPFPKRRRLECTGQK